MKAVILASGTGSRLQAVAAGLPKALVPVGGVPLLERALRALADLAVGQIVITTGYRRDKVEAFLRGRPGITCVHNPRFAETNYLYSLWLCRDALQGDDLLLLHSDLLFDPVLLRRMAVWPGSAVLVREGGELPPKDFKARIADVRVREIGVHVGGEGAAACMPLYKLAAGDWSAWMARMDAFVAAGRTTEYAEEALNDVLAQITLSPAFYSDEQCMEIDTPEDFALACALVAKP